MSNKTVCIVIPTHKNIPSENEIISLLQLKKTIPDIVKYLVVPEKLDASKYVELDSSLVITRFADKYFVGERGYNVLCRRPLFYRPFFGYNYMLIYQLDCFVFRNELLDWCGNGFDYIAPAWMGGEWIKEKAARYRIPWMVKYMSRVGNGGFSLRRVDKFYKASFLTRLISTKLIFHEDIIWSNIVRLMYPGFKVADVKNAVAFGFEDQPEKCMELNKGNLPFGCHAWGKYNPDFWKEIIRSYGFEPD